MLVDYLVVLFLFKQKTAYEMRISDWSSDVCSSDFSYRPTRPAGTQPRIKTAQSPSNPGAGFRVRRSGRAMRRHARPHPNLWPKIRQKCGTPPATGYRPAPGAWLIGPATIRFFE